MTTKKQLKPGKQIPSLRMFHTEKLSLKDPPFQPSQITSTKSSIHTTQNIFATCKFWIIGEAMYCLIKDDSKNYVC